MKTARKLRRALWLLSGAYAVACLGLGLLLAAWTLHLHRLPVGSSNAFQTRVAERYDATVQDQTLAAADGVSLKAWLVVPAKSNGRSVIILHGITANRVDSTGFAEIFLARGYAVLLPDSRDHGESGGNIATYGLLERDDVRRWVDLLRTREPGCTYLLGESMGAAIGLEATAVTPRLCAVAVESPYAEFREISYERLGRDTPVGNLLWKTVGRPIIEIAILATKLRYGLWLPDASPLAAIRQSKVPALLIAGDEDHSIPMHHARELAAACGQRCELWIVAGADHGGASTVAHAEFERRILDWFAQHGE